jgi:hypothetical protein
VKWTERYCEDRCPTAESLTEATRADLAGLITSISCGCRVDDRFNRGAIVAHLENGILVGACQMLCERVLAAGQP